MHADSMEQLADRAATAFKDKFGRAPMAIHFAPGRVNLIGEHTDYNDGYVLPVAIREGTAIASAPQSGSSLDIVAADYGNAAESLEIISPIAPSTEYGWRNHVRGVAACFQAHTGRLAGGQIAIAGNVPQGAGLSSSASLGVSLGLALGHLSGAHLLPLDLARIAQDAENRFAGCDCGIMDPLISAAAQSGTGLLIDCSALEWQPVPVPPDLAIIVAHSGVQRGLAGSAYNARRQECLAAADALGFSSLRQAGPEHLSDLSARAPDPVFRRARHVIGENARTRLFARLLPQADLKALGEILNASHASLRADFEVTVPAVDSLVEAAQQIIGQQGGARMTGGGFGGCIVAICASEAADQTQRALHAYLGKAGVRQPLVFHVQPEQGARQIR
jgi:galactokinase